MKNTVRTDRKRAWKVVDIPVETNVENLTPADKFLQRTLDDEPTEEQLPNIPMIPISDDVDGNLELNEPARKKLVVEADRPFDLFPSVQEVETEFPRSSLEVPTSPTKPDVFNARKAYLSPAVAGTTTVPQTQLNGETDREVQKSILDAVQKKIGTYNGYKNAKTIKEFIERFERYCTLAKLHDRTQVSLLPIYLDAKAKTWWDYYAAKVLPVLLTSDVNAWPTVKTALHLEFMPKDFIIDATKRLHELNLNNGLSAFIQNFRDIAQSIPNIGEDELIRTLEGAITADHRDYLDSHREYCHDSRSTLELLQAYAERHEKKKTYEKSKSGLVCFNCGKVGHKRTDCRIRANPNQVNVHLNSLQDCTAPRSSNSSVNTIPVGQCQYTEDEMRDFRRY